MIKAIIFDVGGVLIDYPWPKMIDHYLQYLDVDRKKLFAAMKQLNYEWQSGIIDESEYWNKIGRTLKTKLPQSESLWLEGFKKAYKEKDEIFILISLLKKKGYKIGLLSNTEAPVMNFLIEKQYEHFDVFIYSCAIGLVKPDRKIYEKTLKLLQVSPEEAIFIDDKEENVEGAKKIGIQGVLFKNSTQIENLLKSLL